MAKKLQEFDFDKSHYERPAQKWVCGRLEQGCPCNVGPDKKGNCRVINDKLYECTPWKDEDRWKCARPKSLGGACEDGPSPIGVCCSQMTVCQPKLSHRAKRGRTVLYCLMVATGILCVFMFGIYTKEFASPGALIIPHSAITAKVASGLTQGRNDCSVCHTAGEGNALAWIKRTFTGHENNLEQSLKCLQCHKQAGNKTGEEVNSLALNIHGVTHEILQKSSENIANSKKTVNLFPLNEVSDIKASVVTYFSHTESIAKTENGKNEYKQMACATCHREHHGRKFNLTALTNQQCQTCHNVKFASFANGHPVFDNFPYERRTRIMFDHNTHFAEYFKTAKSNGVENPPEQCNACHKLDGNNHLMVVKTFEETCIQCHQKDILRPDDEIGMIRFPGINSNEFYKQSKLNKVRPEFKNWPSIDEEGDGEYTVFMFLLLSEESELKDDEISDFLEEWIGESISEAFPDTEKGDDKVDKAEVKALNAYVKMIQRLVQEIMTNDSEKLKKRLEKVLKISLKNKEIAGLFPNADKLLQVIQSKILPPINPKQKRKFKNFEFENPEVATGWYFSDFTLKYRPKAHKDAVMKTWLDVMVKAYNKDKDMTLEANTNDDLSDDVRGNTTYVYDALRRCLKCHSVDENKDGNKVINWRPNIPSNKGRFNKFSHSPHLALLDDVGCKQCHTLKQTRMPDKNENFKPFVKADYNKIYEEKDPHKFISNFEFMKKDLCSQCHIKSAAGNNCTLCHNYHVNPFSPALNTKINDKKPKIKNINSADTEK